MNLSCESPRTAKLVSTMVICCIIVIMVYENIMSAERSRVEEIAALQASVRNLHAKHALLEQKTGRLREGRDKDMADVRVDTKEHRVDSEMTWALALGEKEETRIWLMCE